MSVNTSTNARADGPSAHHYHNVHTPLTTVTPNTTNTPHTPRSSPAKNPLTPFAAGPSVVAKSLSGSGVPETVTVGADTGFGFPDEELVTVNRDETAYVVPCVEFIQRRK